MATRDVRKETPEVIYELRVRAVEMKRQGLTHETIADTLDVSMAASRRWWRMYCEDGMRGLVLGRRGRPAGVCRRLSKPQEKVVMKTITGKTPEQLKLPFALWTRPVIRQFIHERFGIRLPVRTLGHYLKRWGFTPQRPKKAAYEQQPAAVRKWIDEQYPAIMKCAKAVNGWLAQRHDKIELFFLPPYSPELNPDEYLNNTVKGRLRNQPSASTHSELHSQLTKVMRSAQKTPVLIRNLFKHPAVAYAA
jgi:transposase